MPTYEYQCATCGPFTAFRPMADYAKPAACDVCGGDAPRAFLTAPAVAGMDASRRTAFATNERARHEPRRASGHPPGCGCCKPRTKSPTPGSAAKTFPGTRPWMISH